MQGHLTGWVKFDSGGLRQHYKMDVMEVSLNRGLAKVSSMCFHPFHVFISISRVSIASYVFLFHLSNYGVFIFVAVSNIELFLIIKHTTLGHLRHTCR